MSERSRSEASIHDASGALPGEAIAKRTESAHLAAEVRVGTPSLA